MTHIDPFAIAGAISVLVGGFAAVGLVIRLLYRVNGKISDFLEDWNGEAARLGVPRRKGVMERLSTIEKEVTLNGGRSLKDAVTEISRRLDEVAQLQLQYHPQSPVQINVHPNPAGTETAS